MFYVQKYQTELCFLYKSINENRRKLTIKIDYTS